MTCGRDASDKGGGNVQAPASSLAFAYAHTGWLWQTVQLDGGSTLQERVREDSNGTEERFL